MITKYDDTTYEIDTQGLSENEKMRMQIMPHSRCGNIENGVAFKIPGGAWVVSTDDFLEMAEIIKRELATGETAVTSP